MAKQTKARKSRKVKPRRAPKFLPDLPSAKACFSWLTLSLNSASRIQEWPEAQQLELGLRVKRHTEKKGCKISGLTLQEIHALKDEILNEEIGRRVPAKIAARAQQMLKKVFASQEARDQWLDKANLSLRSTPRAALLTKPDAVFKLIERML